MAMAWTPVIGSSGLWPGTVVPKPSAMALTIALGAAAAAAVFGELTIEEALILAVVLAPTDDGALGKALVTDSELVSTEETIRRVRAVDEADVAAAARDLFAPEKLSAAGIGPRETRFRSAVARVNPALAERS